MSHRQKFKKYESNVFKEFNQQQIERKKKRKKARYDSMTMNQQMPESKAPPATVEQFPSIKSTVVLESQKQSEKELKPVVAPSIPKIGPIPRWDARPLANQSVLSRSTHSMGRMKLRNRLSQSDQAKSSETSRERQEWKHCGQKIYQMDIQDSKIGTPSSGVSSASNRNPRLYQRSSVPHLPSKGTESNFTLFNRTRLQATSRRQSQAYEALKQQNDKILAHDPTIERKMNQLNSLLGNSRYADDFKGSYLKMLLFSDPSLATNKLTPALPQPGTSLERRASQDSMESLQPRRHRGKFNYSALANMNQSHLAMGGGALANHNPIHSIDRLIKQHKPYIAEACAPNQVYQNLARFNPKHFKKLYQIEDVIMMSKRGEDSSLPPIDSSINFSNLTTRVEQSAPPKRQKIKPLPIVPSQQLDTRIDSTLPISNENFTDEQSDKVEKTDRPDQAESQQEKQEQPEKVPQGMSTVNLNYQVLSGGSNSPMGPSRESSAGKHHYFPQAPIQTKKAPFMKSQKLTQDRGYSHKQIQASSSKSDTCRKSSLSESQKSKLFPRITFQVVDDGAGLRALQKSASERSGESGSSATATNKVASATEFSEKHPRIQDYVDDLPDYPSRQTFSQMQRLYSSGSNAGTQQAPTTIIHTSLKAGSQQIQHHQQSPRSSSDDGRQTIHLQEKTGEDNETDLDPRELQRNVSSELAKPTHHNRSSDLTPETLDALDAIAERKIKLQEISRGRRSSNLQSKIGAKNFEELHTRVKQREKEIEAQIKGKKLLPKIGSERLRPRVSPPSKRKKQETKKAPIPDSDLEGPVLRGDNDITQWHTQSMKSSFLNTEDHSRIPSTMPVSVKEAQQSDHYMAIARSQIHFPVATEEFLKAQKMRLNQIQEKAKQRKEKKVHNQKTDRAAKNEKTVEQLKAESQLIKIVEPKMHTDLSRQPGALAKPIMLESTFDSEPHVLQSTIKRNLEASQPKKPGHIHSIEERTSPSKESPDKSRQSPMRQQNISIITLENQFTLTQPRLTTKIHKVTSGRMASVRQSTHQSAMKSSPGMTQLRLTSHMSKEKQHTQAISNSDYYFNQQVDSNKLSSLSVGDFGITQKNLKLQGEIADTNQIQEEQLRPMEKTSTESYTQELGKPQKKTVVSLLARGRGFQVSPLKKIASLMLRDNQSKNDDLDEINILVDMREAGSKQRLSWVNRK